MRLASAARKQALRGLRREPRMLTAVELEIGIIACQRGETHKASSAATPSAPYSGRPYQRARPSASVSSARGCRGASGRRALRTGSGPSCTSTRVMSGPGRMPIHRVCIVRLLGDDPAGDQGRRRGSRGNDARRDGLGGSLMRHVLASGRRYRPRRAAW
jgi:hypothetical protein